MFKNLNLCEARAQFEDTLHNESRAGSQEHFLLRLHRRHCLHGRRMRKAKKKQRKKRKNPSALPHLDEQPSTQACDVEYRPLSFFAAKHRVIQCAQPQRGRRETPPSEDNKSENAILTSECTQ